jgi:hypothetical protein
VGAEMGRVSGSQGPRGVAHPMARALGCRSPDTLPEPFVCKRQKCPSSARAGQILHGTCYCPRGSPSSVNADTGATHIPAATRGPLLNLESMCAASGFLFFVFKLNEQGPCCSHPTSFFLICVLCIFCTVPVTVPGLCV